MERDEQGRRPPSVDEVLRSPELAAAAEGVPRWALVAAVRVELERVRQGLRGGASDVAPEIARIAADARARLQPGLRGVVNATGVVLHTNLGRAPLAEAALARIAALGGGYTNLEYDLGAGGRGAREDHVAALASALTGAEAALVVNNCAGAVLLGLSALAAGREVIVSRGELVEIGGAFRVPDVMAASGARLVEVGTTNKTHARDYEAALRPETALLLKVHRSNFALVGFTSEVSVAELARVGGGRVPVMMDLGSGALRELPFAGEPTVPELVRAGADLVTFSGDKLLGGPQAGLMVGRRELIAACARHPLYRALRPDKLTLAALEATLELYRDEREDELPALGMLMADDGALAERLQRLLDAAGAAGATVPLVGVRVRSAVGGGALPLVELPSWAVALGGSAEGRAAALRAGTPPVVGRVVEDRLVLDVRTIQDAEVAEVAAALAALT